MFKIKSLYSLILLFWIVGCTNTGPSLTYIHGYEAQKAGAPANANPYIQWPEHANTWLNGWMAANTGKAINDK